MFTNFDKLHPSHKTRPAYEASSYDEVCEVCGATDVAGGGWGLLALPCKTIMKRVDPRIVELQKHLSEAQRLLQELIDA